MKETFYCTTKGSHIKSRSLEGLLIRGININTIFTVKAKTMFEAGFLADKKIKQND